MSLCFLFGICFGSFVFADSTMGDTLRSPQFFALAGPVFNQEDQMSTKPALELDYLSPVVKNFTINIGYLNEAHFDNNFRDGLTIEPGLWLPGIFDLNFNFALGPYFYADTVANANNTYEDQHGLGVVMSASLIWQKFAPYLFNVSFNHIQTLNDNLTTNSLLFGVGVDLDQQLWEHEDSTSFINLGSKSQVDGLIGDRALNSGNTLNSLAYSVAYHYLVNTNFNWSVNYIHEGATTVTDRRGLALMGWEDARFDANRFMLGLGAGPYFSHDTRADNQLNLIVGGETGYFVNRNLALTLEWDRIITTNNTDSDLFMGGVAWLL